MTIKLHARNRGVLPKNELHFTSFRVPIEVAKGIDVRGQKVGVSFSEAVMQVLEQFVAATKAPKGFKSKLKPSKHARDTYAAKPKKVKAKAAKIKKHVKAKSKAKAHIVKKKIAKAAKTRSFRAPLKAKKHIVKTAKRSGGSSYVKPVEPKVEAKSETAPELPNGASEGSTAATAS